MNKLRVAIAGYGIVGKRRHLYIDQHPSLEVVAVCDQNYSQDFINANGIHSYTNYEKLLQGNHELDILFVCLPNNIAAEVTIAGLSNGLHVFCEKPPGRDV